MKCTVAKTNIIRLWSCVVLSVFFPHQSRYLENSHTLSDLRQLVIKHQTQFVIFFIKRRFCLRFTWT